MQLMNKRWSCRALVAWGLLAALSGCRYLSDDKGLFVDPRDDYLEAEVGRPINVPPDLTDARIVDSWPIPLARAPDAAKTYPGQPPRPEVFVGSDVDAVKIQRLGARSWVVLPDAPEQVWPLIKQFLADNGVTVGREDPPGGVIESAWIVLADREYADVVRGAIRSGEREAEESVPSRYRLRFRVERGIRRGSTEVHVEHDRAAVAGDEAAPPIAAVQAEMTTKLADYFAHAVTATVSMVGKDIAAASKAQIVKDAAGYPSLRLHVDFDRAWATVGQALDRAEVELDGTDRDAGIYRALFPVDGKAGWLRRLAPGKGGRDAVVIIHLTREGERVLVRVRDENDRPVAVELAEQVLLTLREFA